MRRAQLLPTRVHLALTVAVVGAAWIYRGIAAQTALFIVGCAQVVIIGLWAWRQRRIPGILAAGLTVMLTCFSVQWVIVAYSTSETLALTGSGIQLLGSVSFMAVLGIIVGRRRGTGIEVLADGVIVALGSWILTWVILIKPMLELETYSVPITIVNSFYQPADSVLLFLIAVLIFTLRPRPVALRYLTACLVLNFAADTTYAAAAAGRIGLSPLRLADASYVFATFMLGAAFNHRSAADLFARDHTPGERRLLGRLLITTLCLVVPVMVLALFSPHDDVDSTVRAVSAAVLAGAVMLRVVQSVRANAVAQAELLRAAQTDPLTGLPNRALLLEYITDHLHQSWRTGAKPALFFMDVDRFKNINDSLGHAAGDQVLRTIAERLQTAVPPTAVIARISGDELVVMDPMSQGEGEAMALAERLLDVFREPLALPQGDVFVTASVGVAQATDPGISAEDLLRHADTAMYRAKDAGRNCVALFDESMHERVAHRLSVETALYRALDRRELRLFHQPIVDITTGEVVGFEALMRWEQSDGTIVSPAEFIPIAEDTGTIVPIGAWALLEALTQLRTWIDDDVCSATATMSINVSPRQLSDPNFPSIVSEALMRSQVPPGLVWLEVTESMMISDPELALATLRRLRELGVRVALDDFGTGYSSLSLLQRFPLQRIKIDRAFVHGVADNPNDRSLVRTIVAMGTSLGLDMVAEGVESVHQLQVLNDLGCYKAQGYLISHPVPADAMRSTVSALERLGTWPGVQRRSGASTD